MLQKYASAGCISSFPLGFLPATCNHVTLSIPTDHHSRQCHAALCRTLWLASVNKATTVTVTEALVLRPLLEDSRAHHRVNPYPGARRQNGTEVFSYHDETSPSIAAVSASSAVCSMLAVQQQKRLCRQFVDVPAA